MFRTLLLITGLLLANAAAAQVQVKDAWARPAVPGQSGTGAFMTLTAPQGAKLVSATSPVAGVTELHEMSMEGNVMKMRAIPSLDLPAGRAVELKSGGHHLMLMDLKQPLKAGDTFTVELKIIDAQGKPATVPVQVQVRAGAPVNHHHSAHQH